MCRILAFVDSVPRERAEILGEFANKCKESEVFQGHGWGITFFDGSEWRTHKEITPIWDADFSVFPAISSAVVHARSAFRDEGIAIENNMPFENGAYGYIFNGELNGVKVRQTGRIGAEKVFNLIMRLHRGDIISALNRTYKILQRRSERIHGMNIAMVNKMTNEIVYGTYSTADSDYYTMWRSDKMLASFPLSGNDWEQIPNGFTGMIS